MQGSPPPPLCPPLHQAHPQLAGQKLGFKEKRNKLGKETCHKAQGRAVRVEMGPVGPGELGMVTSDKNWVKGEKGIGMIHLQ